MFEMKRLAQVLLILLLGFWLTGCGSDNLDENDTNVPNDSQNEETTDEPSEATTQQTGRFIGQADPHTIEIETDNGVKAFQVPETLSESIANLTENDMIGYTYTENDNDQLVIQSIELLEKQSSSNEQAEETKTGTFNGQVDPHTVEIETSDGAQAFQLSEKAQEQVQNITEKDSVTFTYYKKGEQLIIESINALDE